MVSDTSPLVRPRLVLGIIVFLIGGLLVADQAGGVNAESAASLWPVGLIALGLVVVLQPDPVNRRVGGVLLVAGVWLLLNAVGWWSYSFWRTWPYLLVIGGSWLLYRVHQLRETEGPANRSPGSLGRFDDRVTDAESVGALAFCNGVERVATSGALRTGDFHAVLGVCELDLSHAAVEEVEIDTFALLGRVAITVPAGCRVESRVLPILARVDNACAEVESDTPGIVLRGAAILGRVEVSVAD